MTNKETEAIAILQKEYLCVNRNCNIERSCAKCDLMMPNKEPILQAYKTAIEALEKQGPKWIPVSEELPDKEGYYVCSVRYMYPPYNFFEPEKVKYMDDVTIQKFDGEFNIEVKAWMPLPEPYEAESENKDESI